jgi:amino acid adenylation domain-containing protein/non-ribosomal peptide synthase protein (TIGR01720 family)
LQRGYGAWCVDFNMDSVLWRSHPRTSTPGNPSKTCRSLPTISISVERHRSPKKNMISEPAVLDAFLIEEREYWRRKLRGHTEESFLSSEPADLPEPGDSEFHVVAPAPLYEKLFKVTRGSTLLAYTALASALSITIRRYGRRGSVIIGSPALRETGVCNLLPVMLDVNERLSFQHWLAQVREVLVEAYNRQRYPFASMLRDLKLEPGDEAQLCRASLSMDGLHGTMPELQTDLVISCGWDARRLEVRIRHDGARIRRATIERFAEHFLRVLKAGLDNSSAQIADLPMMSDCERDLITSEWSGSRDGGEETCLHEMFEAWAVKTPDALAVAFEDGSLTYSELAEQSNRFANYLRTLGAGPEQLVAICLEGSLELIVAVLGVLKTGATYVPLDPEYPPDRLAFIIEDAAVGLVVSERRLLHRLPATAARLLCMDGDEDAWSRASSSSLHAGATPQNLAYVIYTSGSTGRPKGVLVSHRGLRALAEQQVRTFGVGPGTNVLQFASFSFDSSLSEIVMALANGATLHLANASTLIPGPQLIQLLRDRRIGNITIPPSALAALSYESLPDLNVIIAAGEPCPAVLAARWAPGRHFFNNYGPTEATVWSTFAEASAESTTGALSSPIGRPIKGVRVFVLDDNLRPLPIGVPGELYLEGKGLARGYLNLPALTAERFIPNSFADEAGERLYRTGDLVRWRVDGQLEYLDRVDQQVKLRGYRIEMGEIESLLATHPEVAQCAVVMLDEALDRKQLAAYFVPARKQGPTAPELRAHLESRLPKFMVPSLFVQLQHLPVTPNGKLDRRALAALGNPESREYHAPRTLVEELIVGIWAQLLHRDPVGIQDNFFELGGHSLLAVQVILRVRAALGVEIPLLAVFDFPSPAAFAEQVDKAIRASAKQGIPPIAHADRTQPLPLSFAQQRLWFIHQLEPDNPSYHCPAAIRITGPLDVRALHRSLSEIVRRHEVLRTSFPTEDGRTYQSISPVFYLPLPVIDLIGMSASDDWAEGIARAEFDRRFDLGRGPLLRVLLLRLGTDEFVLLLTIHHIASDGWSVGILIREFREVYEIYRAGRESALPELAVQYADYAVWQREWLKGEVLEEQMSYWRNQLEGMRRVELPVDKRRPEVASHRSRLEEWEASTQLWESIKRVSREEAVTVFMTLMAGLGVLLSRYCGQSDVAVGTDVANREQMETEGLIGLFVNQLVMRMKVTAGQSFREVLKDVRKIALGAYAHQDLPFEKLVDELEPERDLARSPLFQVFFEFQKAIKKDGFSIPGLRISKFGKAYPTAKFDLTLTVSETDSGLHGSFEYVLDLFEPTTVERMAAHYLRLLESAVSDPDKRVAWLELLTANEQRQIMVEWNGPMRPVNFERYAHELFADQCALTPSAIAVSCEDQQITYAELNHRANALAHLLNALSLEPEARVCVCVARSLDLVIALLAVWKAGCVYVPLDPEYPKERLAYFAADAQASVLLTQQGVRERVPNNGFRVILLDVLSGGDGEQSPLHRLTPTYLAYAIYTSGSTGRPKGAMIEHRGLINHLQAKIDDFGLTAGDVVAQNASSSFDISVWQIMAALLVGGRVQIIPDEVAKDGWELLEEVQRRAVTVLETVPVQLGAMVEHQSQPGPHRLRLEALRWMICNAEALPSSICDQWLQLYPHVGFVNAYGATECSDDTTHFHITGPLDQQRVYAPLGKPLQNLQYHVVDADYQIVPVGVMGELFTGGVGVGRGYLNHPELTAERFVPDPFSNEPGLRIYRTGDLVRRLPDGNLDFIARVDNQVQIRGHRVELGEIEAVLRQHSELQQALVTVREEDGQKRLVAYFVARPPVGPGFRELRLFLRQRLPDFMVPSAFVALESLPVTSNGKVDFKALPAPGVSHNEPNDDELHLAKTPVEEVLVGIWKKMLRIKQVGVHDNFFGLGGDSILAIQVAAQANQTGLSLRPRHIFQHQTIAELAAVIGGTVAAACEQGLVTGWLPLTPIQRRFFARELPSPNHFNQALLLQAQRQLVPAFLRMSAGRLMEHHDALRLRFIYRDGQWHQTIAADTPEPFAVIDLSALPEEARRDVVEQAAAQLQESLNLSDGPLARLALFDLGPSMLQRLLFVAHHLAFDGMSWRILLEDLENLYTQMELRRGAGLPAKSTSIRHWAQRLISYAEAGSLDDEISYWQSRAEGVQPLPVDFQIGENTAASMRTLSVEWSADQTHTLLHDVPRLLQAQVPDVLLTALACALAMGEGTCKILVDVESHGREDIFEDVDLSRTIGWFTAIYPVQLSVELHKPPKQRLDNIRRQLEEVPSRGFGYGVLKWLTSHGSTLASLPKAEISFNYLGQFDQVLNEGGLFSTAPDWKGPLQNPQGRREYLLDLTAAVLRGRLQMGWSYSTNISHPSIVERIAERFSESLNELLRLAQPAFMSTKSTIAGAANVEFETLLSEVSFEGSHD